MNEKKKLIILIVAVVALIAIIPVAYVIEENRGKEFVNDFLERFEGQDASLIYIGRPTCSHCESFKPVLDDVNDTYGIDYLYINTDEINSKLVDQITEKLGIEELGTPYIAIVKDNKVVAYNEGELEKDSLINFYTTNKLIDKNAKVYFKSIDYSEYDELIKSKEQSIIVIGQTGCPACEKASPVLKEIAKDKKITINYLNLTNISDEESTKFFNSLDLYKDGVSTPTTIIIKNGKVLDNLIGFNEKEDVISFLKENKIIK